MLNTKICPEDPITWRSLLPAQPGGDTSPLLHGPGCCMRALCSSTNSLQQLLSSIPTSLQQGWAVRPTAERPSTTVHGQQGGFRSRVHGHGETNGPGHVVFGNRGGLTCSVSSFLFKKIPNPIKALCLKDLRPCRAFLCCCSTPHADQGHLQ